MADDLTPDPRGTFVPGGVLVRSAPVPVSRTVAGVTVSSAATGLMAPVSAPLAAPVSGLMGPMGPMGPVGPRGLQGEAGPAGGIILPAYTLNNVTTDRVLDADSTSIDEVVDVLGTLIADIQSGVGTGGGGGDLDIFTASADGLVPASGGGTANYLRADGTWTAPAGTGGGGGGSIPAYALTNVTTDRIMDADLVTIDEMADVLGTLITDIAAGGVGGGGGSGGSTQALAETRAAAVSSTIDVGVKSLRTAGYTAVGDRGHGLYSRLATVPVNPSNPGVFRSMDRFTSSGVTDATHGGYWQLVLDGPVCLEQFGGKGDYYITDQTGAVISSVNPSPTDNRSAFYAAMQFLWVRTDGGIVSPPHIGVGVTIRIGYGAYYMSDELVLDRSLCIEGSGVGWYHDGSASRLIFAAGKSGIILNGFGEGVPGAGASHIRNLYLKCLGFGGQTTKHGITLDTVASIEHVTVEGFGGNGIDITADIANGSNANHFYLNHIVCDFNAGHGVYCQGGDANAGYGNAINAFDNNGWGIYDNSFLGNTWISCHTAGNIQGAYKSRNDTACASPFIGCYSEGGQPASEFGAGAVIIGGLHGSGGTGGLSILGSGIGPHKIYGPATDFAALEFRLRRENNALISFSMTGAYYHDLRYSPTYGTYALEYANTPGNWAYYITSGDEIITNGRSTPVPPNRMAFPNGLWIGGLETVGSTLGGSRWLGRATSIPTTGVYAQGDAILFESPTAGGFMGAVCVTAGTPGTWKTFGAISA